jgi:GT2 family glycosyltransferase
MRDVLVLGSGRSGTSMVTGALARAGYHLGESLHVARAANPKGFFEAAEVNDLNDELLANMLPADSPLVAGQRWLGVPRADAQPTPTTGQARTLRRLVARRPFCFKDPRFSFTLPAWREAAPDAGLVCVFRHPAATAVSMVEEVASAKYLAGVAFDTADALALWTATYRAILEKHAASGDWLFLHYDQVLAGDGLARLGAFTGAAVDASFPDGNLRRDPPQLDVPAEALALYAELCARAGHADRAENAARRTHVAVVVPVEDGQQSAAAAAVASARALRGAHVEVVVLDRTRAGFTLAGVTVERTRSLSFGADLAQLAGRLTAPFVALELPGCGSLPSRLGHALAKLEGGADVVTCDYALTDAHGQFVQRSSPAAMGDTPGPFFEGGLVARRSFFETLDTRVFSPALLVSWRRAVHGKRATHVTEPGFALPATHYAAAFERSRADARLATKFEGPATNGAPELSVSICTYQRCEVLAECLEAFCRQDAPRGSFELVVVDDGSTDGTHELLAGLEWPVPVTVVTRANGGLSAARNSGLEVARGRYVLFVNDDTIPHADCVSEHLAAHRAARLVGEPQLAVLGTFEQPLERCPTALARSLERSNAVFDYASLAAGERYDAWKFWTCNVSVALDLVRAAGGFDPSFRHYGCEDTDLARRLEKLGMRVLYHPRARAQHRHDMDFAYLERRGELVARAYVRLVRKHPELLARWGNENMTRTGFEAEFARERAVTQRRRAGVAQLARLDHSTLAPLCEEARALFELGVERITELLPHLNRQWWRAGYAKGLAEHGLAGFDELVADGTEPWPLATNVERRLLARPDYRSAAALDRLTELLEPVARDGFAALVLRRDPLTDPSHTEVVAALEEAFARRFGAALEFDVVLEDGDLSRAQELRFGRSCDAFLSDLGEPSEFVATVAVEHLGSADDVASWRRRFEGSPGARNHAARAADRFEPELTVVVPTCDRPRELAQLVARLAANDLDPLRFEVLVVDDGSLTPVPADLGAAHPHVSLSVLRQERSGPAAARNLALARARGRVVLFLNDDAVPAHDLLARHLAAHAQSTLPRALLGRFSLLPQHRVDSLAEHVETTTTLFAQPLMQAGVHYHGLSLCTGNVSLRREHLLAVGGFDAAFTRPGGEDSELGFRLQRQLGLRVVYEPALECGHDHVLDVRALAARKRVVGASLHRMQTKHGDLGLVPGMRWPIDAAQWERIEREVDAARAEVELLTSGVERVCASERATRSGARALGSLSAHLARIERVELFAGLVEEQRRVRDASSRVQRRIASARP